MVFLQEAGKSSPGMNEGPSWPFSVCGHRGAAAKAEIFESEQEIVALPALALAELVDGAHFAGGTYLTKAMQLVSGRNVAPFDKECSLVAGRPRADREVKGCRFRCPTPRSHLRRSGTTASWSLGIRDPTGSRDSRSSPADSVHRVSVNGPWSRQPRCARVRRERPFLPAASREDPARRPARRAVVRDRGLFLHRAPDRIGG